MSFPPFEDLEVPRRAVLGSFGGCVGVIWGLCWGHLGVSWKPTVSILRPTGAVSVHFELFWGLLCHLLIFRVNCGAPAPPSPLPRHSPMPAAADPSAHAQQHGRPPRRLATETGGAGRGRGVGRGLLGVGQWEVLMRCGAIQMCGEGRPERGIGRGDAGPGFGVGCACARRACAYAVPGVVADEST